MDKKLDKIKGFFSTLWDAISCSTSTSAIPLIGKRPAPTFTWSTSEEHTSSDTSGASGSGNRGGSSYGKNIVEDPEDIVELDD